MPSPTLAQLRLARGDQALTDRITLAADKLGTAPSIAANNLVRILAAPIDGDTSLANVYEYHWTRAVQDLGSQPADRDLLNQSLARVGADPAGITDAQIEQAVAAALDTA